jgi:hypothetical protein
MRFSRFAPRRASVVVSATFGLGALLAAPLVAEAQGAKAPPPASAAPAPSAPPASAPPASPAPTAPSAAPGDPPASPTPTPGSEPAGAQAPPAPAPPATAATPGATTATPGAPGTITVEPRYKQRKSRYLTWDANIDGAFGYSFQGDGHLSGFGRVRGGLLFVNEEDIQAPSFRALGLTYEISELTPATFGLQFEFMSLNSGAWFQVGAMVDIQPRPGFMLGAGLSLLGVEGQVRWSEGEGAFVAIYGKLRIPLGIIGFALSN